MRNKTYNYVKILTFSKKSHLKTNNSELQKHSESTDLCQATSAHSQHSLVKTKHPSIIKKEKKIKDTWIQMSV